MSSEGKTAYSIPAQVIQFLINYQHTIAVSLLTLLSCWTRFHLIGKSRKVVWDEV